MDVNDNKLGDFRPEGVSIRDKSYVEGNYSKGCNLFMVLNR